MIEKVWLSKIVLWRQVKSLSTCFVLKNDIWKLTELCRMAETTDTIIIFSAESLFATIRVNCHDKDLR